jgi:hypothetical protein
MTEVVVHRDESAEATGIESAPRLAQTRRQVEDAHHSNAVSSATDD